MTKTNAELADAVEGCGMENCEHLRDQIIAALRKPCPHIVIGKEGTSYCSLVEPPSWDKIIADLKAVVASVPERQPSSDQVLVPRDIGELAQDMVATMNHQPGYKLAITHGRILKIAQEVCRLYELSKLAAAEAEGHHE